MFDIGEIEGDYLALQRALDFLCRLEGIRSMVTIHPQVGGDFRVDIDDFAGARGGLFPEKAVFFLIFKKDFNLFFPLLVNQVPINRVEIKAVKDTIRNGVVVNTRTQAIVHLRDVLVTGITQAFYKDLREKRTNSNGVPATIIRARTGRTIPDMSQLTQVDISFDDQYMEVHNRSIF
jgi:hypothetical protein